jgi:hypothetical protein
LRRRGCLGVVEEVAVFWVCRVGVLVACLIRLVVNSLSKRARCRACSLSMVREGG